jgi:hypothetical protein
MMFMTLTRRNGENGSGLGVVFKRYWMILVVAAAAGGLQVQAISADDKIQALTKEQQLLRRHLVKQATMNGAIDERTKAIQRQLEMLIKYTQAVSK